MSVERSECRVSSSRYCRLPEAYCFNSFCILLMEWIIAAWNSRLMVAPTSRGSHGPPLVSQRAYTNTSAKTATPNFRFRILLRNFPRVASSAISALSPVETWNFDLALRKMTKTATPTHAAYAIKTKPSARGERSPLQYARATSTVTTCIGNQC
jgi:hypothetical protein